VGFFIGFFFGWVALEDEFQDVGREPYDKEKVKVVKMKRDGQQ